MKAEKEGTLLGTFRCRLLFSFFTCLIITAFVSRSAPAAEQDGAIILTAEEIQAMKAHKMADVLNQVPGVSAGDSSVSIHGSYKVKVLVDGRPINDPTSSYGAVKWDLVKPDDAEPLSLVLNGKYTSKAYRNKSNTKTVPEYFLANLRVEYAFEKVSLFGEVKNLSDKTYYYVDGLLATPLTWFVGVNWRI